MCVGLCACAGGVGECVPALSLARGGFPGSFSGPILGVGGGGSGVRAFAHGGGACAGDGFRVAKAPAESKRLKMGLGLGLGRGRVVSWTSAMVKPSGGRSSGRGEALVGRSWWRLFASCRYV